MLGQVKPNNKQAENISGVNIYCEAKLSYKLRVCKALL